MQHAIFTLGADVGGKDAFTVTNPHILDFRRILKEICSGEYSDTIKEFALVLRFDGEVQTWGESGVKHVSLSKKNSFVTADVFMPRNVWEGGNSTKIRTFLAEQVRRAIIEIGCLAKAKNIRVNEEQLASDINMAVTMYLK